MTAHRSTRRSSPVDRLTDREREVLAVLAYLDLGSR